MAGDGRGWGLLVAKGMEDTQQNRKADPERKGCCNGGQGAGAGRVWACRLGPLGWGQSMGLLKMHMYTLGVRKKLRTVRMYRGYTRRTLA